MPYSLANSSYSSVYHYDDVIMSSIASQITSLTIVYSTIYSGADQSKHQSSASLAFVWGIHRGPVNSPHKWPVTRKMFPFDDVIMYFSWFLHWCNHTALFNKLLILLYFIYWNNSTQGNTYTNTHRCRHMHVFIYWCDNIRNEASWIISSNRTKLTRSSKFAKLAI